MTEKQKFFVENGYYIEKNLYSTEEMKEMFILFFDTFLTLAKKFSVPLSKSYFNPSEISYPEDLKQLDGLMLDCFNFDKGIIGEGYDIISYSSIFLRFLSSSKIELITKELLNLTSNCTLYGWTNRVRIDPPSDERRTYGWHQEVFYTIPESRYLQTWCPVIRDTTSSNGTIWIAPGSHKEGVAKQSWNEIEGRATQIIVDQEIINKYSQIQLEMKVGDVLFFDGKLSHKSGSNTTKDEIRFSLVGMWHDIKTKNFRGPMPNFQHRTEFDQKSYWEKFNKEKRWGY
jgi:hypothetical protein